MRRAKIQTEDGTILRAYLHSPGPGAHPGIIMCPGFGGVKPFIDPNELCAFPGTVPEEYREAIEFEPAGWLPYVTPKQLQSPRSYSPSTAGTSMPTRRFSNRQSPRPATGSPGTSECRWAATHLGSANR